MSKPVWMPLAAILAVHDRQIAGHGGATGMCDMGMCHMMLETPAGRDRETCSATVSRPCGSWLTA